MIEAGETIELPDCPSAYLFSLLVEIGPVTGGGMVAAPIGWRDVEAWQHCTGVRLPPWQSRLLVALSRELVRFGHEAVDPECRAPWLDEPIEERRERVSRQLSAFCNALSSPGARAPHTNPARAQASKMEN